MLRLLCYALLLAATSGCASSGLLGDRRPAVQLAPQRDGFGLVYISRPAAGFASDVWPNIHVDQKNVISLKNGTYSYLYLRPGRYEVAARKAQWYSGGWGELTTLAVEAGNTYFLSLDVLRKAVDGANRRWARLAQREALSRLRNQNYVAANVDEI